MKSIHLLKTAVIFCGTFLFSSCLLPEDVVDSGGFEKPVKIISISPDSAFVGDNIIITGENFIPQEEYNQVWFGGNVKASVDSGTSTKLFLKLPDGAQTGAISVSNGVNSDTLKSSFKILKTPAFKKLFMSLNGIKVTHNYSESGV